MPEPVVGRVPVLASPFAHSYFESLSAFPNVIGVYSLRDQVMLDTYAHGPGIGSKDLTYDFVNDPDPRRQDAAKLTIPAGKVHPVSQVRLPIASVGGDSLLVTWDAWWGREFRFANTNISTYKSFQFASPLDMNRIDVRTRFDRARNHPTAVGMVDVRYAAHGDPWGPNMINNLPITPQSAEFLIQAETWTRYWAFFKPVGAWHEFSLWVADEQTGPVLLIDRIQVTPSSKSVRKEWEAFWFEFNTSDTSLPAGRGVLVAYIRNVVMLRSVQDASSLLERPE